MKKKTVFMIGATAILGVAALDVVNVPVVNEPTVVYAATTTQKQHYDKQKATTRTCICLSKASLTN